MFAAIGRFSDACQQHLGTRTPETDPWSWKFSHNERTLVAVGFEFFITLHKHKDTLRSFSIPKRLAEQLGTFRHKTLYDSPIESKIMTFVVESWFDHVFPHDPPNFVCWYDATEDLEIVATFSELQKG